MSYRLTRIYTRSGDKGHTRLGDGTRIDKDALRVNAYGTVDEANSAIGVLLATDLPEDVCALLITLQHQLFNLGAELSTPDRNIIHVQDIDALEHHIDCYNQTLPPLQEFVLPSGGEAAARCHLVRTIVRRAERETVALARQENVRLEVLAYLNRLSDLLFVLARVLVYWQKQEEIQWNHQHHE